MAGASKIARVLMTADTIVIHSMTLSGDPPMPLLITRLSNQRMGEMVNILAAQEGTARPFGRLRSSSDAAVCSALERELGEPTQQDHAGLTDP